MNDKRMKFKRVTTRVGFEESAYYCPDFDVFITTPGRIHINGWCTREELRAILAEADRLATKDGDDG